MLRSKKYRFIFVHIPKSAGSSMYLGLKPYSDPFVYKFISSPLKKIGKPINFGPEPLDAHSTAMEIRNVLGSDFQNYFKFAFGRNPWERICSSYFYIKKDKKHPAHFQTLETKDVNEFISKAIYIEKPQTEYIFDENDNQIVDFIGRYENLQNDFEKVLKKINIKLRLQKLNVGKYQSYKKILNQKSIEIIYERYKKDISILKYQL